MATSGIGNGTERFARSLSSDAVGCGAQKYWKFYWKRGPKCPFLRLTTPDVVALTGLAPAVGLGGDTCLFTRDLYTLPAGKTSKIRAYSLTTEADSFTPVCWQFCWQIGHFCHPAVGTIPMDRTRRFFGAFRAAFAGTWGRSIGYSWRVLRRVSRRRQSRSGNACRGSNAARSF